MRGHQHMLSLRGNIADEEVQDIYREQQANLLYAEEIQCVADLSNFDFVGGRAKILVSRAGFLWLDVPGLAENRPSVLKGDRVLAWRPFLNRSLHSRLLLDPTSARLKRACV
jgi:helicase MOV-10